MHYHYIFSLGGGGKKKIFAQAIHIYMYISQANYVSVVLCIQIILQTPPHTPCRPELAFLATAAQISRSLGFARNAEEGP